MSAKRSRRISPNPDQQVPRIAEAVAGCWGRACSGGTDLEIPVGVLAALTLIRPGPSGDHPADHIRSLSTGDFCDLLRHVWARFAILRPDLSPNVAVIRNWLWEDRRLPLIDAAHDVATTALSHGLLDLYAHPDTRRSTDLFGPLLVALRPDSAITARGQIYTPHGVAELIAHILGPTPEANVYEPAVGTGAMLAAAANVLRAHGRDPSEITWYANDIDPIAVACLAVNAHLWDLGPKVLFAVADTITEPHWVPAALAARQTALDELRSARLIAACQLLTGPNPARPLPGSTGDTP